MHFNRVAARLTAAVLLVSTLVTPASALTGTVSTGGDKLHLRAESTTESKILKKLANGTRIDILKDLENGWYQVSYEGTEGYVSGKYVVVEETGTQEQREISEEGVPTVEAAPEDALPAAEAAAATYVRVVSGPLNVRSGPGTDYDRVDSLHTGKVVEFQSLENGWYKIESGYICGDYVEEVDESALQASGLAQQVVDYALQFKGYRYVYGGSSPSGFDCSGFTSYVYRHFGYSLNRSASGQLDNGTPVSMSELQPGDLVIFKKGNSSKRATHVGIYIGGGQFIHASTAKVGVIISKLSDSYYTKGFVGGRRII